MPPMNDNVLFLDDHKHAPGSQSVSEWQCANLLARFFHYLDEQRHDDVIALFTPEGRWHRQGRLLVGDYAIRAALQVRAGRDFVRHVLSAPCVSSGRDQRMTVQAAVTVYAAPWDPQHTLPLVATGPHQVLNTTATMVPGRRGFEITELIDTTVFCFNATPC